MELFRPGGNRRSPKGRLSAYEQRITRSDEARVVPTGDNTLTRLLAHHLAGVARIAATQRKRVYGVARRKHYFADAVFAEDELSPKEADMLAVVQGTPLKAANASFTQPIPTATTHHPSAKTVATAGIKAAVMRASVKADEREDWVADRLDRRHRSGDLQSRAGQTGLDLWPFDHLLYADRLQRLYADAGGQAFVADGQREDVRVYLPVISIRRSKSAWN